MTMMLLIQAVGAVMLVLALVLLYTLSGRGPYHRGARKDAGACTLLLTLYAESTKAAGNLAGTDVWSPDWPKMSVEWLETIEQHANVAQFVSDPITLGSLLTLRQTARDLVTLGDKIRKNTKITHGGGIMAPFDAQHDDAVRAVRTAIELLVTAGRAELAA